MGVCGIGGEEWILGGGRGCGLHRMREASNKKERSNGALKRKARHSGRRLETVMVAQ